MWVQRMWKQCKYNYIEYYVHHVIVQYTYVLNEYSDLSLLLKSITASTDDVNLFGAK